MKQISKVISVLLIFGIVMGLASPICLIYAENAAEILPEGAGMIIEFDSHSKLSKVNIDSDKTKAEYDAAVNALKVNAAADNVSGSLVLNVDTPEVSGNAAEYPVMAMRVKLADAAMAQGANSVPSMWYWLKNGKTGEMLCSSYKSTDEWQTVYMDFSNYTVTRNSENHAEFINREVSAEYRYLTYRLYDYRKTDIKKSATFYVAWIGVFDSVESVYNYSSMNYSRVINFDEEPEFSASGSGLRAAKIGEEKNVTLTETTASAALEYDGEENALKVIPKQVGKDRGFSLDVSKLSISTAEYPVVAYRLRLTDAATGDLRYCYYAGTSMLEYSVALSATGKVTKGDELYTELTRNQVNTSNYTPLTDANKTDEWQLMVCDFSDEAYSFGVGGRNIKYWTDEKYEGYWSYLQLALPNYRSGTTYPSSYLAPYYVEWVGFFSDISSAREYAGIQSKTMYDFTETSDVSVLKINGDNTEIYQHSSEGYVTVKAKKEPGNASSVNAFCFTMDMSSQYLSSSKYPVLALRVRLRNEDMALKSNYTLMGNTDKIISDKAKSPDGTVCGYSNAFLGGGGAYFAGEDWQTIYFDFSDSSNPRWEYYTEDKSSNIATVLVNLYKYSYTDYSLEDEFDIAWAGFFESVKALDSYTGDVEPKVTDLIVFDNQANAALLKANNAGYSNTKVKYNFSGEYMTVTATREPGVALKNPDGSVNSNASVNSFAASVNVLPFKKDSAKYPVVALRVRLKNLDQSSKSKFSFTSATEKIVSDLANAEDHKLNGYTNTFLGGGGNYLPTSDWQTIYVDFSESTNPRYEYYLDGNNSNYTSINFQFYSYSFIDYSLDDAFDISWIGFFGSAQEALAKTGEEMPEPVENVIKFDNMRNSSLVTVGDNSVLSYDSEVGAIAVSPKNDNALNASYFSVSLTPYHLNSAEYPIAAIRVRSSQIENLMKSTPVLWTMTSKIGEDRQSGELTGSYITGQAKKYRKTDDWQIIYYDFSNREFARCEYFTEGEKASDWSVLAFSAFNYRYEQAKTTDNIYVDWIGVFKSKDELDRYAGITRTKGALYYDLSNEDNIGEIYNTGYDSQISYDKEQQALKVVAYDMNNDNALNTNVAGFSLGALAGNDVETICPTSEYPILAVRVKLKSPDTSPGWFYFRTSTGSTDYPINRPSYQKSGEWQTVAVDCSQSIMNYYFNGDWTGCTVCLGVNGLSETGDTYFVKWVRTFKTIDEAYAYTGETPPAENLDVSEITDRPATGNTVQVSVNDNEEAKDEQKVLGIDDLIRVKSAAAGFITLTDKQVTVKQVMTAKRFMSAFITASGVTLEIANPIGWLLREDTPVYNGYELIIKKDGIEQMRITVSAPEYGDAEDGVFLDTWQIVLICVGGTASVAGLTVLTVLMIRKRSRRKKAIKK